MRTSIRTEQGRVILRTAGEGHTNAYQAGEDSILISTEQGRVILISTDQGRDILIK